MELRTDEVISGGLASSTIKLQVSEQQNIGGPIKSNIYFYLFKLVRKCFMGSNSVDSDLLDGPGPPAVCSQVVRPVGGLNCEFSLTPTEEKIKKEELPPSHVFMISHFLFPSCSEPLYVSFRRAMRTVHVHVHSSHCVSLSVNPICSGPRGLSECKGRKGETALST